MNAFRIVIMAKAPIPGLSKTRLIPDLGPEATAMLARRMFCHSIDTALKANLGTVECCVVPDHNDPIWTVFKEEYSVQWSSQVEGSLGKRMAHVAERVSKQAENIILMGIDCPMMNSMHLRLAAAQLEHSEASMIPVADGGYCLLALREFHPAIFHGVSWSTPTVAKQTRKNCLQLGWHLAELKALHDVDHREDLKYVPAEFLSEINF
ncbi:hypothetical protein LP43_2163 [Methylophaga thiooxydans]|uniref:Glycosyltransferase n=1 Tax=Methylophaga thiooxydans TaxID=392484 RepID=A0A0A0BGT1_9GAMM|nr:TIGR04282 family arsenosugar biosynthesis glycosyltransferase [Methylophaga thiooxydans]KGM06289.1 hypothetical protein LP43_2163 [Methylophaga thiooxydans]